MNVLRRRTKEGRPTFLIFDKAVRDALSVEPTNDEIAEALGLKSPMVTPEPPQALPGRALAPTAPALFPVPRSHTEYSKLTGAKNLQAISDHIRNKLRWDGGRPDSWIARDAMLAFQLPEHSRADVEAFVAAMRKGIE